MDSNDVSTRVVLASTNTTQDADQEKGFMVMKLILTDV